jgi:hypothetical protein
MMESMLDFFQKDNIVEVKKTKEKRKVFEHLQCEWCVWWWLQSSISLMSLVLFTFIYIDTTWP